MKNKSTGWGWPWTEVNTLKIVQDSGYCEAKFSLCCVVYGWGKFHPLDQSLTTIILVDTNMLCGKLQNNYTNEVPIMDQHYFTKFQLTHWGWAMHICVSKPTIIGSDNGLSPEQCKAIIWTNAGMLLIWPLGTNSSEILIGNQTFSFKKMHLKVLSAKWRPFCLDFLYGYPALHQPPKVTNTHPMPRHTGVSYGLWIVNNSVKNNQGYCNCALCFASSGISLGMHPSQWEMSLQCNDISHWLGAYLYWSL